MKIAWCSGFHGSSCQGNSNPAEKETLFAPIKSATSQTGSHIALLWLESLPLPRSVSEEIIASCSSFKVCPLPRRLPPLQLDPYPTPPHLTGGVRSLGFAEATDCNLSELARGVTGESRLASYY